MKAKKIGAIVVGVILVSGTIFGISGIEKIKPGYVGVVYSMNGGVQDEVLSQGWNWIGPGKKVVQYSVATEQLYLSASDGGKDNTSFDVICKDGKLNVDFEMSYSFDSENVSKLYTRYRGLDGRDIVNNIVQGKIKTYVNEVTSKYSVLDAHMEKKGELNADITSRLKEKLSDFGIVVESANLTQTRADETVQAAITKRSAAAQELEAETLRQEQTKKEAETAKIKAQGEAEAKLIQAEAEAKSNNIISQSLTEQLLKQQEVSKWNGSKATTVVNGAEATVVTPAQ